LRVEDCYDDAQGFDVEAKSIFDDFDVVVDCVHNEDDWSRLPAIIDIDERMAK
jgi:hypothetical protein